MGLCYLDRLLKPVYEMTSQRTKMGTHVPTRKLLVQDISGPDWSREGLQASTLGCQAEGTEALASEAHMR